MRNHLANLDSFFSTIRYLKMNNAPSFLTAAIQVAKNALWAPIVVFAAHELGTQWIDHEPYFDPVIHFAGGAAMAFFFFHLIAGWQTYIGTATVAKPLLLAFGLTVLVGIAWELMEYLIAVSENNTLAWSLLNTLRDLALDSAGAAMLLVWLQRRQRQH
jgi:hypothetical protein